MSKKLILIDGHSILNRAFFGVPPLTNSEGLHTNAVYGFLNIMFKILDEEKPDYLTVAFDRSEPTFRHQMFDAYKGTRKPMAQELREQVPVMKEVLQAMGIKIMEMPGYEADDLLGTIAGMAEAQGMDVSIISGDRDLLQLATEKVKIRIPKTKRTGTEIEDYYATDVVERYQVTPKEFIDVKALMGDSSDNIPGVPGIGEKTATNLIVAYKSIENAYAHLDEITPKRAKTNLEEHYDMAQMSKTLATIEVHAPIEFDMEAAKLTNMYTPEAYVYMKRLEFKNMLTRFSDDMSQNDLEKYFHVYHELDEIQNFFDGFSAKEAAVSFFEEAGKPLSSKEGALLQVLIMLISVRLELFFRITLTSINELGMSLHASTALSKNIPTISIQSSTSIANSVSGTDKLNSIFIPVAIISFTFRYKNPANTGCSTECNILTTLFSSNNLSIYFLCSFSI